MSGWPVAVGVTVAFAAVMFALASALVTAEGAGEQP